MDYFERIYELSLKCLDSGDVPVGALIVYNNQIIGEGYNTRELDQDVLGHAEINAIKMASKTLNNWNLDGCVLYVTLKPCSMCMDVIKQARISKVYYLLDKDDSKKEYSKCCFEIVNNEYSSKYKSVLSKFFSKMREKF